MSRTALAAIFRDARKLGLESWRMSSAKTHSRGRSILRDWPRLGARATRIHTNPAASSAKAIILTLSDGHRAATPAITRRTIGRVLRILRKAAPGWNAPLLSLMAAERRDPFL